MQILIINGPNLHNIGLREPNIYGNIDFKDYLKDLQDSFKSIKITYQQTHSEGEMVNFIANAKNNHHGIIINAGAYSHNSTAIRDAISASDIPCVGVHISNIYKREKFRMNNMYAANCIGIITGFGIESYKYAIIALIDFLNGSKKNIT